MPACVDMATNFSPTCFPLKVDIYPDCQEVTQFYGIKWSITMFMETHLLSLSQVK